jgi:hypothetical protein
MRRESPGRIVRLVLPTGDVFDEFALAEHVLVTAGSQLHCKRYTFKGIAECVIRHWASSQTEYAFFQVMAPDGYASPFDRTFQHVYGEYVSERRLHGISYEDTRAIRQVVLAFAADFYWTVVPTLDRLDLSDYQLETLEIDNWLGNNMVLEISRS